MNPEQTPSVKNIKNPLEVLQPGEEVLAEVKRHPIGLLASYIMAGILLLVLGVVTFILAPTVIGSGSGKNAYALASVFMLFALAFSAVFLWITNTIYWGNRWIITTDSITQVLQTGLFNKQSSQLSLANLEDVTAEQNGVLAHMFNYGVLKAETAGEHSKFTFIFCPNPNYYAQIILNAREQFQQKHGEE